MSAIRSRGNVSTELSLVKLLRKEGISGWRRQVKIFGIRPDFSFTEIKLAVFVHGCFWHGCKLHKNIPQSNRQFWLKKITLNKLRDLRVRKLLKHKGWVVLQIWEHDLKNNSKEAIQKLRKIIPKF